MSRSKDKGTRWETAVVNYLRENGEPNAERRALSGALDRGDIGGVRDAAIETKDCKAMALASWVDEAETERINAGAKIGVVWHKRRGKSSPADAYVTMTGATLVRLLAEAGYLSQPPQL